MSDPDVSEVTALDRRTLARADSLFDEFEPWRGMAPVGRTRNFLGTLLPPGVGIAADAPSRMFEPERPRLRWGEGFFEFYSTL